MPRPVAHPAGTWSFRDRLRMMNNPIEGEDYFNSNPSLYSLRVGSSSVRDVELDDLREAIHGARIERRDNS